MGTIRRALIPYVLTAACSSATLSTDTPGIEGVYVLEDLRCDGQCYQESVNGAALAQGAVWITRSKQLAQCNGPCTIVEQSATVAVTTFGADGGVQPLAQTPTYTSGGDFESSGVGVAADGSAIYFVHGDPTLPERMVFDALTPTGADAGSVTPKGPFGRVVGVVPDTQAAIVAVGDLPKGQGFDPSSDQGSFQIGSGQNPQDAGVLYRVDFADGGVTSLSTGANFATTLSAHLFAGDAANVYWVSPGVVWSAPRDLSTESQLGTIPVSTGMCDSSNFCDITGPVGLDVANGVVAVAVLRGSAASQCSNNGPCTSTLASGGCIIKTMPATTIYDDPTTSCMGLAIDGTDAYFGIVEQVTAMGCCAQDGSLQKTSYLRTTGIGRVPLSGAAATKPAATFTIGETTRFFGPRRFFVDGTYVYGIDPAYVLRVAKTAFH